MEHNPQPRPRPAELKGQGTHAHWRLGPNSPRTQGLTGQGTQGAAQGATGAAPGQVSHLATDPTGGGCGGGRLQEHKGGAQRSQPCEERGGELGIPSPKGQAPAAEASGGPPEQGGASLRAFSSFLSPACFRGACTFPNWFCPSQTGTRLACARVCAHFIISEESICSQRMSHQ